MTTATTRALEKGVLISCLEVVEKVTGSLRNRACFSLQVRREGWMGEIDSGWTKFHVYHCYRKRKNVSILTRLAIILHGVLCM